MSTLPGPLASLSRLVSPDSLRRVWSVLRHAPGGGLVMGRILGNMAPYTGSIRPEVIALEEGYARVRMRDRRAVRNHLRSVHAIALMNLGEVATGVAMMFSLPTGMRGIITHLEMDYLKKARGPITAECRCPPAEAGERREYDVTADLLDESGTVVARALARWMVGPES
jgi:acyl-coenzyme A thioesterase PaaI-like protein